MKEMQRTHTCGDIRKEDTGKTVILNGWVHRKRDHGGISFINLRDRYGLTQVVVDEDSPAELTKITSELKMEYCIAIEGVVRARPETMINPDMVTGEIEIVAKKIHILSTSDTLPLDRKSVV